MFMPEFKERSDNALRHRVWILGGVVCSQELDSILVGPFQPGIFCDSIKLFFFFLSHFFGEIYIGGDQRIFHDFS